MKEKEVTKIVGAVLFAALVLMVIRVLDRHVFHPEEESAPAEQAAKLETPAQPSAAAPQKPAETKMAEQPAAPPAAAPAAAPATKEAAAAPAAAGGGDADAGGAVFKAHLCFACHSFEAGKNGAGPSLHGVFGRAAAQAPGFAYSDGLKGSGITWNEESINKWVQGPQAVVADAKMVLAKPVTDPKDRADLIAYIKRESSK